MSLQDLGSLGELIGAIAVLFTLIYLAIQTRHTRMAAEQTAKSSVMQASASAVDMYSRWREMYLSNPEIREALNKSNQNNPLSELEQSIVTNFFHELFITGTFSYAVTSEMGAFQERSTDVDYMVEIFRQFPCAIQEWNRFREIVGGISPEFARLLEARVKQIET